MNSLSQSQRAVLLFGLLAATVLLLLGCGGGAGGANHFAGVVDPGNSRISVFDTAEDRSSSLR